MPDVEGSMDAIPQGKNLCGSKIISKILKYMLHQGGEFRESKMPNMYQGYLVAMSTIVPCTFDEIVKHL